MSSASAASSACEQPAKLFSFRSSTGLASAVWASTSTQIRTLRRLPRDLDRRSEEGGEGLVVDRDVGRARQERRPTRPIEVVG